MANHRWSDTPVRKLLPLRLLVLMTLALLALACAPAAQPTTAPQQAAPEVAAPTATTEAAPAPGVRPLPSTEGTYIEKAGLQIFVPKGNNFGGPTIPPDPREPRYGGGIIHVRSSDTPTLDPTGTTTMNLHPVVSGAYERLIHWATEPGTDPFKNPNYVPGLAESWEISGDFLTWTFHLRKGVKWQNVPPVNGREFTSDDVVFSYEYYTRPDSILRPEFAVVKSVVALDRYTVVYRLNQVSPGLFYQMTTVSKGYILPREAGQGGYKTSLTAVGTGPFIVATDYEFKVGIDLRRNPDYWATDAKGNRFPYLDKVGIRIIPDSSARLAAFRTGKIQDGFTAATIEEAKALLKTNPNTLIQETFTQGCCVGFTFRMDKEPWNDVRVRHALSMAIDYETMTKAVFGTRFHPSLHVPGFWVGETNTIEQLTKTCGCPWYQYNPEGAKALLAEAGFGPNKPLSLSFEFFVYGQTHTAQVELIDAYWRAIGVKSALKSMEYTIYRNKVDRGSWDDVQWSFDYPVPQDIDSTVASLVPGSSGNDNFGWINNPKLTQWVTEFTAAYGNEAIRLPLLKKIRAETLDQVYFIPNLSGPTFRAIPPFVRNYQPAIGGPGNDFLTWRHAWIDEAWIGVK